MNDLQPNAETLWLRITGPAGPFLRGVFPEGNTIGTQILAKYLGTYLELRGLMAGSCNGAGELNRSVYMMAVTNASEAAKAVLEALQRFNLFEFHLYRFDAAEDIFRCVFPEGGNMVSHEWLLHEFDSTIAQTEQFVAALNRAKGKSEP